MVSINQYLTIIHRLILRSEGLPQLNDEVLAGKEPTMIVVYDLSHDMCDVNELVADMFTKICDDRDMSILYVTQNLFDKKQVCENHYCELVLFGVVKKLSRCWTICNFCETDVPDLLEVCCREV